MERIAEPDALMLEFGKKIPSLVLASSSPNRRALLERAGCRVRVFIPDADETREGASYEDIVSGIARRKMEAYLSSPSFDESEAAIAADTLVLFEGSLIGKPADEEDAGRIIRKLAGNVQKVISASSIKLPGHAPITIADTASVIFRDLSDDKIESYIQTGEWKGAAGGYRVQKTGYRLIERIDGDWTTVVGLPMRAILDSIRGLFP